MTSAPRPSDARDPIFISKFHCPECGWIAHCRKPFKFEFRSEIDPSDGEETLLLGNDELGIEVVIEMSGDGYRTFNRGLAEAIKEIGTGFHCSWAEFAEDDDLQQLHPSVIAIRKAMLAGVTFTTTHGCLDYHCAEAFPPGDGSHPIIMRMMDLLESSKEAAVGARPWTTKQHLTLARLVEDMLDDLADVTSKLGDLKRESQQEEPMPVPEDVIVDPSEERLPS